MATNKKSFLLYTDIIHTVKQLPDDKAGQLFKHILAYVNDQDPDTEDMIINIAFEPIKQQLKRDLKKYSDICEKNRLNVGKRWNKINTTEYDRMQPNTKNTDNDNDNDNDNDIKNKAMGLPERKINFKVSVNETVSLFRPKYLTNLTEITKFIDYWTEHGPKDKKMRFEKEKSFGIQRRLDTWFERSFNGKLKTVDQSDFRTPDNYLKPLN